MRKLLPQVLSALAGGISWQATPAHALSFLAVPELVRLRGVCRGTKEAVDGAWTWNVLIQDLNKANRFNVIPHSDPPVLFVLSAEDSEEDLDPDFQDFWAGQQNRFAATDPRIQPSYAGLTPYGKFASLFAFAEAAVKRLHKHFGIDRGDAETQRQLSREWAREGAGFRSADFFDEINDHDPAGSSRDKLSRHIHSFNEVMRQLYRRSPARFHTMMHLIALNVAAEDLSAESGCIHFRKDSYDEDAKEWVILDTGSMILTSGSFPPLHRAIGGYLNYTDNSNFPPSDAQSMGSAQHLQKLLDGLIEDRSSCES
jgi:hypothetical protein